MNTLRRVLHDLVTLRLPVTAAATVAAIVGLLEPFGVDLSASATRMAAVLALVGYAAACAERYLPPKG